VNDIAKQQWLGHVPTPARQFGRSIVTNAQYAAAQWLAHTSFTVDGTTFKYCVEKPNRTWTNERAVELPLAAEFLARTHGLGLEVGNVLGHYGHHGHTVVDKYDVWPGVLNVDVVDYSPEQPFHWIVALSTLEHVGWDEEPFDPGKAEAALRNLLGLLVPNGRMLVSIPLGYNRVLDRYVLSGRAPIPVRTTLLERKAGNRWRQLSNSGASERCSYDFLHARALRVLVAEYSARDGRSLPSLSE
jgi:hypothetical protein